MLQTGSGGLGDQAGVVGGIRQLADDAFGVLGFVRVEHAGANTHPHLLAQRCAASSITYSSIRNHNTSI